MQKPAISPTVSAATQTPRPARSVTRGRPLGFIPVMEVGAPLAIRSNPNHLQQDHFDRAAHRQQHKIENMRAKLKERRAIATRSGKTAASFTGGPRLTAAFQWLS